MQQVKLLYRQYVLPKKNMALVLEMTFHIYIFPSYYLEIPLGITLHSPFSFVREGKPLLASCTSTP